MTKPTQAGCGKAARRLSSLPALWPQTKTGQDEIVKALHKYCRSDEHAEAVMSEMLETAIDPKNVIAVLVGIATRPAPDTVYRTYEPKQAYDCQECQDTGIRSVARGDYSFGEPCACARGKGRNAGA